MTDRTDPTQAAPAPVSAPAGRGFDEPLTLTVHAVDVPQTDLGRTRAGRLKMLLILLACAAPVIASYLTYYLIRPEGRTNYGDLIAPARPIPPQLALSTLDGQAVEAARLRGQWLLVVVGEAACEAACQQRLYEQRQLREMLGRDRDRVDKVWLVTDEGPVAPALLQALQAAGTRVLRVPRAALSAWLHPAAGFALADHLYVIDPRGDWMLREPARPEPARVKRDLERLLRASASWDTPGR